jgi:hypothetical protein
MSYKTTRVQYGRTEIIIDVRKFATDLSAALGGSGLAAPSEHDANGRAQFRLGADEVTVYGNGYHHKGRVEVRIDAPEVPYDDRNMHNKEHHTESATVDPDARTIERIAADIKKRVIDPSQEALRLQREYAAGKAANRSGICVHMETLRAAMPNLQVRKRDERALDAQIYSNSAGHYVGATMAADGHVSIQHIGSMSLEKFVRMMRAINEA